MNEVPSVEARISVRIPKGSNLKQRLAAVVRQTGIPESLLVLRAVEAVVDHVEQHQQLTLPFAIQEQAAKTRRLSRAVEQTAKIIPLVAAVLAGCCALIDCELLDLNILF